MDHIQLIISEQKFSNSCQWLACLLAQAVKNVTSIYCFRQSILVDVMFSKYGSSENEIYRVVYSNALDVCLLLFSNW